MASNPKTTSSKSLKPRHFEIIKHPRVTEKSHSIADQGKVVFSVLVNSSKSEIKSSIEAVFNLKIESINTLNMRGKRKIFKGRKGKRSDWKKAVVTLKDKSQIKKLGIEAGG